MKELQRSLDWICFHEEDMDDDDIQVYERNFIISLTAKLSENDFTLPGLINGEVAKSLDWASSDVKEKYKNIKKKIKPDYNPSSYYVFPDFLIHESHSSESNNLTQENQHVVIEAKTSLIKNKVAFFLDFFKLNYYLRELNFETAIYLLVRTPLSSITEYVAEYEKTIDYLCEERFNRMYFFIQEKLDNEPKIYKIVNE